MKERFGLIKFAGRDATVLGEDIQVGQKAPDFTVQAQDWTLIKGLETTLGKVRILAAVPSLDTAVCDRETRRFNEDAAALGSEIVIMVISADLPFAQKRWCGAEGIERISVLSDHMFTEFGLQYGCLIKEARLLRRAVFVVDRAGKVVYVAYMPALGEEPNYAEVLAAARSALAA